MRDSGGRAGAALSLAGLVLLAIWVSSGRGVAETASQRELLADLEAFEAERAAYRRLLPGDAGMSPAALAAYREALLEASARWVVRWPAREFAWRARLQALLGVERRLPDAAWTTVQRALEAGRQPSGLAYAEPLELLAARVLVQHRTHLEVGRRLCGAALHSRLEFLDRLSAERSGDTSAEIEQRKRRWRWEAAVILARAAAVEADLPRWRAALGHLAQLAPEKPVQADRDAAIAYAAGWLEIHLHRARLAVAAGDSEEALAAYQRAVSLRPAFPGKIEPPLNQAAIDEALTAWIAAGRSRQDWDLWISRQKGFPIPGRSIPSSKEFLR